MTQSKHLLATAPSESAAKRILRSRAQALARPTQSVSIDPSSFEVLQFRLASERYALETRFVHEVYPLRQLTSLPCTPPFLRGIVNVRGRIVSVIDLKRFFDLPDKGLTDLHRIILVRGNDIEVGVLADEVMGVRSISGRSLQASLPTLSGIRAEYLKGVTDESVVVLDVARILADPKIVVDEEVEP